MRSFLMSFFFICITPLVAQSTFTNPIIPGGYPDPSICRVGEDFYIVNSSFEYFPGLPIHHSKDLVNWKLIGYGLHRPSQASGAVNLVDVQENGGIHAPTIRYNKGTFYIVTTNMYSQIDKNKPNKTKSNTNFIITAKNPAGPWSEPHVIEGAPGIDPDLFFDDDGKVYFVGTHNPGDMTSSGIGAIWAQELDLEQWKLVGDRHSLWEGACDKKHTEGPHIYKENGKYYLLVAEGGTSFHHAVMIAASDDVFGPYETGLRNPILTSRHLSKKNWVHSTGHADLVKLADGRWFMVALGKRNDRDGHSNMGRETHLMPVVWEPQIVRWQQVSKTKWEPVSYLFPVVAPETGKVERINPLPFPDKHQYYNDAFHDNFDSENLTPDWSFRRVPQPKTYSLSANKGHLRLYLKPENFQPRKRYSAMGITQKESQFEWEAKMKFTPKKNLEEAGISVYQKDINYINLSVQKIGKEHHLKLTVKEKNKNVSAMTDSAKFPNDKINAYKSIALPNYDGEILLKISSKNGKYSYFFSTDGGADYTKLAETPDNLLLGMMYTGANVGIFATSNGQKSNGYADFDWVSYKGFVKR
ncbi:glycoside hydrolase family 43 protein [Flavobacteriaceae bacterium]|nr:glycoside hydrolase family 43 protein [Flavobacteriaceae bacterium]MDA8763200.1 glycoside hydrolase family 43 protein [Flavobacteriaceae bacterium]MDB2521164.1 glycoside hydrolase family 43 protein [Flavobacteriaceae bacterium]|tara:strand:- start:7461 stop:9212 length:1752 start_codon:yes stop_codon:yes gene_type:complete